MPQDRSVPVLGEVRADLHRIRTKSNPDSSSILMPSHWESHASNLPNSVLYQQLQDVHNPDKPCDKLVRGLFIDLPWGADLFQVALRNNHDTIGNFHGLFLIVLP